MAWIKKNGCIDKMRRCWLKVNFWMKISFWMNVRFLNKTNFWTKIVFLNEIIKIDKTKPTELNLNCRMN